MISTDERRAPCSRFAAYRKALHVKADQSAGDEDQGVLADAERRYSPRSLEAERDMA